MGEHKKGLYMENGNRKKNRVYRNKHRVKDNNKRVTKRVTIKEGKGKEYKVGGRTVLEAMINIKKEKGGMTMRRSCREGICGSCGININGKNTLACIRKIGEEKKIRVRAMTNQRIIKEMVTDMTMFNSQYKKIKPFRQGREEREKEKRKIERTIERCIWCGCCTTACPSYWWNSTRYIGPAVLLQAGRWYKTKEKGKKTRERKRIMKEGLRRCHNIRNCTEACPKKIDVGRVIRIMKEEKWEKEKK